MQRHGRKVAFQTCRARPIASTTDCPKRPRASGSVTRTIGLVDPSARHRHCPPTRSVPDGVAAVRDLVALRDPGADRLRALPRRRTVATGAAGNRAAVHRAPDRRPAHSRRPPPGRSRRDGDRDRGLPSARPPSRADPPTTTRTATEIHVLVPKRRQVRSVEFVHVERTLRLPTPILREGIPLAPLVRACTDAARRIRRPPRSPSCSPIRYSGGCARSPHCGTSSTHGTRRGTAVPRAVLADLADGVRSAAERAAKQLWPSTGLPEPWWNADVWDADGRVLGIADCWLDEVAMLWEIESSEWHLDPAAHEYTVRRAAQFTAAGVVYVASKPKMVLNDRAGSRATLRAAYVQACRGRRPPLRAQRRARRA